jgi:hypothetical protein
MIFEHLGQLSPGRSALHFRLAAIDRWRTDADARALSETKYNAKPLLLRRSGPGGTRLYAVWANISEAVQEGIAQHSQRQRVAATRAPAALRGIVPNARQHRCAAAF